MRFFTSVNPDVIIQFTSQGKYFITFIALMRFLPSMYPDVSLQVGRQGK